MTRDVGGRYRLAGDPDSRPRSIILAHFARSSMSSKGSLPDYGHLKDACVDPYLEGFQRISRATIFRMDVSCQNREERA